MGTLLTQMRLWSETLPLKTYQAYLDEGANFLTELTEGQRAQHDEALTAYYDLARDTNPKFEIYRETKKYKSLWSSIDRAVDNRSKNLAKRDRGRRDACRNWGTRGESFMQLNDAILWSHKAGKLAKTIPDYGLAMIYLNRVLYQKRLNTRQHRHISLVPGGTDLVNAIELFKADNGYGRSQARIVEMTEETSQAGPSDDHRGSSEIDMRIAQGNPAQESDLLSPTSTQPTVPPSHIVQTGPSTGRQNLQELSSAITPEPASTSSAAAAQTLEHQEMREVDMSAPPESPTQDHVKTSTAISQPAVPGELFELVDDPLELREANMIGTTGDVTQEPDNTSNIALIPLYPGGAPQQAEDDDLSDPDDCLCVINEYMDLDTMRFIDSLPDQMEPNLAEEMFGSHLALWKGPA
ncbi:hypothetical protein ZTR_06115 [Talaromyces verruculosus]|nr:hypothetical protein ZTR_06115 [Talaromyces verruculosus]